MNISGFGNSVVLTGKRSGNSIFAGDLKSNSLISNNSKEKKKHYFIHKIVLNK